MGQTPSTHLGSRGNRRRSLRSPFMRRSKFCSSNLSHTFNMPSIDNSSELININIASEEQLMTLPGINRYIAQAIVEHRQAIGRFKRVDDLALVSGIGAEKLNQLRGEICTSRRVPSRISSRAQSLDSLRSSVDSIRPQTNLNAVNIFQLQCVPGLNQELAANIIDYRDKKGPFKTLDDLVKVKGMDTMRVNSIKHHLCLESSKLETNESSVVAINGSINNTNGCIKFNVVNGNSTVNGSIPRTPGHRKTMSVPIKYTMSYINGFSTVPVNDIYELLSAYSYRPIMEEDFSYIRDGKKALRIASWNLHQLNLDKANNPGFREVLCCTILENRVSVLCLQEIMCEDAIKVIVNELNLPTLRRIQEKKCNSRRWQSYVLPPTYGTNKRLGFLYDSDCDDIHIQLKSFKDYSCSINENGHWKKIVESVENLPSKLSSSTNMVFVSFNLFNLQLLVVNTCMDINSDNEDMDTINDIWKIVNSSRQNVLLLGDFYDIKNVKGLHASHCIVNEESETVLEACTELKGRSDILLSGPMFERFTGHSGVIRYGLNHMAIPRGWSWGGPASPHCPVWAEFFVE